MIDLNKLEHFVAVAKSGSFVGAAQRLHISQPALSRSIQALENHYGVVLLHRDRSGVKPTAAGEDLLVSARDLVLSANSLEMSMRSYAAGTKGRVRFGIGPFVGTLFLPVLLAHFAQAHPGIEFEVTTRPNDVMLRMLADGDLVFVIGKADEARLTHDFDAVHLLEAKPRFYARAGHPLTSQLTKVTVADIADYGVVSGSAYSAALHGAARTEEMRSLVPVAVVDSLPMLKDVIRKCDRVLVSSVEPGSYSIIELEVEDLDQHMASSSIMLFTYRGRVRQPAANLAIAKVVDLASEYRDLLTEASDPI